VITCRPSDALALVLRQRMPTPVLVADWVFDPEDADAETPVTVDTVDTDSATDADADADTTPGAPDPATGDPAPDSTVERDGSGLSGI
jgi:hypothetical protein